MVASTLPRRAFRQPPSGQAGGTCVVATDGRRIPSDSLERLERLDDTVFAALSGDAGALDEAATAWGEANLYVDPLLLDESRQHYVRRARQRWRRSQSSPDENLTVGFAALEILGILDD